MLSTLKKLPILNKKTYIYFLYLDVFFGWHMICICIYETLDIF